MPLPVGLPTSERGYAVRGNWAWQIDEGETNPELVWPHVVDVWDQMRSQDAQVRSVLRAVTLPIRRTQWRLDPAGARSRVVRLVAEDLGLPVLGESPRPAPRTRDRFSWSDHLRLALLMLPFGHSYFEQVYRVVNGQARLRKLAWRSPRLISDVKVARDGGLVYIEQPAIATEPVRIPVEHLVAYVHEREGGNWVGQSLLRPAFKFWKLKDMALRTQSMVIDRNGLGVPIYTAAEQPELVTGDERRRRQDEEIEAGSELAQSIRAGENAGAAIPFGAKLTLTGVTGELPDADPVIRYYDEQIARAVLAHFLNLGTETGSWALGSTFADFFTLSLQTLATDIADTATAHIVEDLVDLNFGPTEPAPRIVFDEIGSRHNATAQAVKMLIDCGAIRPDDDLERFVRTAHGMPEADPATAREIPRPVPTSDTGGQPNE